MISFSTDRDVLADIQQDIANNKNKGFKGTKKTYRRVFNRKDNESRAIDKFGDPYFGANPSDVTQIISITLPKSLIYFLDQYCKENSITRSRLLRKMIEYSFNLELSDDNSIPNS